MHSGDQRLLAVISVGLWALCFHAPNVRAADENDAGVVDLPRLDYDPTQMDITEDEHRRYSLNGSFLDTTGRTSPGLDPHRRLMNFAPKLGEFDDPYDRLPDFVLQAMELLYSRHGVLSVYGRREAGTHKSALHFSYDYEMNNCHYSPYGPAFSVKNTPVKPLDVRPQPVEPSAADEDCMICLNEPAEPVSCPLCRKTVGCKSCVDRWTKALMDGEKAPACPNCRSEWSGNSLEHNHTAWWDYNTTQVSMGDKHKTIEFGPKRIVVDTTSALIQIPRADLEKLVAEFGGELRPNGEVTLPCKAPHLTQLETTAIRLHINETLVFRLPWTQLVEKSDAAEQSGQCRALLAGHDREEWFMGGPMFREYCHYFNFYRRELVLVGVKGLNSLNHRHDARRNHRAFLVKHNYTISEEKSVEDETTI